MTTPQPPHKSAFSPAELQLRLDQAWRILNFNQELIRLADQKIYLLIVMAAALVSYVASNFSRLAGKSLQFNIVLALFLLAGAAFFYFALSTVLSRRGKAKTALPQTPQLIFFDDIGSRTSGAAYSSDFCATELSVLLGDICHQIYQLALIVRHKHRAYNRAWVALLIQVTLFLMLEFAVVL